MMNDPTRPIRLKVGCCEDDLAISRLLDECLSRSGHRGIFTRSGAEALQRFSGDEGIDVLVLDVGLIDIDGRDLCRTLRANGQTAPVLFLSGLADVHNIVQGFVSGGLDWVVKPFAALELIARIEALVRRSEPRSAIPDLRIDARRFALCLGDESRVLTPTEFRLAAELLAHAGRLVLRDELVSSGWVEGAQVKQNTLDSYLYRLRQHLNRLGSNASIHTVRGVGYILRTNQTEPVS